MTTTPTTPTTPSTPGLPWFLAGGGIIAVLLVVIWLGRPDLTPAELLARKASRVDLLGQMQLALASGAEAEKSAVLSVTDQEAEAFAARARAAAAEVEKGRAELERQLTGKDAERERQLLAAFTAAFADQQRIDETLLALAVQNSNTKAYALAFGPGAAAAGDLDQALTRLEGRRAEAAGAQRVVRLASEARAGVLRVQALLAPHVAEASDARMDQLEAVMAAEEARARGALRALAALPALSGDADLAAAGAAFGRFEGLTARIRALSRANTDVRALDLSLTAKRQATVRCLDALGALQQAVLDEPIPGVSYGNLPNPRR